MQTEKTPATVNEFMKWEEGKELAGVEEWKQLAPALLDHANSDLRHAILLVQNGYEGEFSDREDFVRQHIEDAYNPGEFILGYIDWDHLIEELFRYDYDEVETENGTNYIFRTM